MGAVYAAYDPDLDRKVALKVLLPESLGTRTQMIHEAQAMAKLTHPAVVQVFEVVGEQDLGRALG